MERRKTPPASLPTHNIAICISKRKAVSFIKLDAQCCHCVWNSNCACYCSEPSCLGTPQVPTSLMASLTNRSLAKNCRQEVITGKKSDQLANLKPENLDGKLAERGAESSLWKLEVGRSRVFGIAQICDGCTITTCGCGSPQGWGIPTWLLGAPKHRKEVYGGNNEATAIQFDSHAWVVWGSHSVGNSPTLHVSSWPIEHQGSEI